MNITILNRDNKSKYLLALSVFAFTALNLSMVHLKVAKKMILAERFFGETGAWIEIFIISLYGAIVVYFMHNPANVAKWRKYTWGLFSVVFFSQLILGISGYETFLMTGKLHLPVPAMIIGGPIYRYEIGFMTILFISTVILSGPAWCSHLCYFGALDNLFAKGKPEKGKIKHKTALKVTTMVLVVFGALIMRLAGTSYTAAAITGGSFGIAGILVIIFVSRRKDKMVHCTSYCPVGTLINYVRFINPFRMYIDESSCTSCNVCTSYCKYDALNPEDIKNKKPGITCTLCGDCITSCHASSIKYKLFRLNPETSRNIWLFVTVSLHAVFMALARI
ncbi:MAG: 4Fe-4S binding protein [Bacteroidales bacterium]|nr:4Fe-4S binding protein [Bacteroidales bacterium]